MQAAGSPSKPGLGSVTGPGEAFASIFSPRTMSSWIATLSCPGLCSWDPSEFHDSAVRPVLTDEWWDVVVKAVGSGWK